MVIFRSVPALILLLSAVAAAIACRYVRYARAAAWTAVFLACVLIMVVLIGDGTLFEGLACLLLPVGLLMKENAS